MKQHLRSFRQKTIKSFPVAALIFPLSLIFLRQISMIPWDENNGRKNWRFFHVRLVLNACLVVDGIISSKSTLTQRSNASKWR